MGTNAAKSFLCDDDRGHKFFLQFIKMGQPRPLFHLFLVFSLQFLQQIYVKKCPSSTRCRDSNPRPLDREPLPITTRPGLPPYAFLELHKERTR